VLVEPNLCQGAAARHRVGPLAALIRRSSASKFWGTTDEVGSLENDVARGTRVGGVADTAVLGSGVGGAATGSAATLAATAARTGSTTPGCPRGSRPGADSEATSLETKSLRALGSGYVFGAP